MIYTVAATSAIRGGQLGPLPAAPCPARAPGLRMALAVCRSGDTFVVTKLDRLSRSLPDARDILDELTKRNVKLSLGGFDS